MPEARFRTTKKKTASGRVAPALILEVREAPAEKPAVKNKADRKPSEALAAWWPLGLGIFMCGFVGEWLTMAQQTGVWAERLLFPLVLLAQHREIGISEQMAKVAPEVALYLQLPLEGLLTKLTLDRGKGLKAATVQLLLVHGVSAFVLWLLTFLGK